MKLKDDLILRELAGQHVVIPVGGKVADFNGVITLNDTAVLLWKRLRDGAGQADLTAALRAEYDVPGEQAEADVAAFIAVLREHSLLRDD